MKWSHLIFVVSIVSFFAQYAEAIPSSEGKNIGELRGFDELNQTFDQTLFRADEQFDLGSASLGQACTPDPAIPNEICLLLGAYQGTGMGHRYDSQDYNSFRFYLYSAVMSKLAEQLTLKIRTAKSELPDLNEEALALLKRLDQADTLSKDDLLQLWNLLMGARAAEERDDWLNFVATLKSEKTQRLRDVLRSLFLHPYFLLVID